MGNEKGEVKIGYADGVSLRDTCRDPVGAQQIQRENIAYAEKQKRGDNDITYAKKQREVTTTSPMQRNKGKVTTTSPMQRKVMTYTKAGHAC